MTDTEIEQLVADLESDRAERKASDAATDKLKKTICAFSNDLPDHRAPGVLFVGVNDDGTCARLPITDDVLKRLADLGASGSIQPLPSMTVQKKTLAGCEIAVIVVQPSPFPPVRYDGRVYVRVGPSTRVAGAPDERRLIEKRRSGDLPFDLRPVPYATLDDLDLDLFARTYLPAAVAPDVLEQNERPLEQKLTSLRLTTQGGIPTVLGILAVGKDPRAHVPGAYIQFLRIDGTTLTDPVKDQKEIDGALPDMLRRLDEILLAHVSVSADITSGAMEIRTPDYPIVALQQLARNAVLHRNYDGTNAPVRLTWFSDRIEILSPGGPYGQVSRETFGQPGVTDYRNPHLAEAMKALGYAQRFGFGIPLARREMEKNLNPPPELSPADGFVLVVLRRRP